MRHLNVVAKILFDAYVEGLECKEFRKVAEFGGSELPVVAERIGEMEGVGTMFGIAHCLEQDGKFLHDTEIVFLRHIDGNVYPMSFFQAMPPVFQESIRRDGDCWICNPPMQVRQTDFANKWLAEIDSCHKAVAPCSGNRAVGRRIAAPGC